MGFLVIVNEADIFVAPALYPPAGGVSGRTTFTVVAQVTDVKLVQLIDADDVKPDGSMSLVAPYAQPYDFVVSAIRARSRIC